MQRSVQLDEGLMILEEAFQKAKKILEGCPETKFTPEEYMKYYACVYVLSARGRPEDGYEMMLYDKFKKSLEESINSMDIWCSPGVVLPYKNYAPEFSSKVLPSLAAKENELLLRELVLMWSNYKLMAKWLCRFFEYLDRYFILRCRLVTLSDTSINCFRSLVFEVLECRIRAAALSLINQDRQGKQIDTKLLQDVMNTFVEIDGNRLSSYYEYFEQAMLEETASFYSQLASQWLLYDSLTDYIQKVNWCIMQEKERASRYLHPTFVVKLLQVVRCQLLDMNANKLIERQQSENCSQEDFQEILSKCASMTLEEESSTSKLGESLSALMAKAAHIR